MNETTLQSYLKEQAEIIADMVHREVPQPGERWRHFKGHVYEVLHLALHEGTLQPAVIYRRVDWESGVWVRPLDSWLERVRPQENQDEVQTGVTYRFTRLEET